MKRQVKVQLRREFKDILDLVGEDLQKNIEVLETVKILSKQVREYINEIDDTQNVSNKDNKVQLVLKFDNHKLFKDEDKVISKVNNILIDYIEKMFKKTDNITNYNVFDIYKHNWYKELDKLVSLISTKIYGLEERNLDTTHYTFVNYYIPEETHLDKKRSKQGYYKYRCIR